MRKTSTLFIMRFLLGALVFLSLFRLAIYVQDYNYFAALSFGETLLAFLHGLRFDFSIILITCGVPLLLLIAPIRSKAYFYLIGTFAVLGFQVLMCMMFSDFAFFHESLAHVGAQVTMIGNDIGYIFETAVINYWYLLLIYIGIVIYSIYRFIVYGRNLEFYKSRWSALPIFLIAAVIAFYGVNGKVGFKVKKMISVADAYVVAKPQFGNLTVNGAFSMFVTAKSLKQKDLRRFVDRDEAIKVIYDNMDTDGILHDDPEYPLSYTIAKNYAPRVGIKSPNIIIVMMESVNLHYIDFFRPENERRGVTPNLDKIAANALCFDNIFPNGDMSLFGVASLMTGIPPFTRIPPLGKGLELNTIVRPGTIHNAKNYYTFSAQGALRYSFRMDSIAKVLGFTDYFGKEDYPKLYSLESTKNGWDGEMLRFISTLIKEHNPPYMGFVFNGTTHYPFMVPNDSYKKFKHHATNMNGYYNTLNYFDSELGIFMDELRKLPTFDETLFVFVGDHSLHRLTIGEEHKIPLIFYSPKYLKPEIRHTLGSQIDIIPTIADMTRSQETYGGLGRSLFAPGEKVAFGRNADRIDIKTEKGESLSFNLDKIIGSTFTDKEREAKYFKLLQAAEQAVVDAVESNKILEN